VSARWKTARWVRWCRIGTVNVERCSACGFDSDEWSDADALAAIGRLPSQWTAAVAALSPEDQLRRPIAGMWSIAEYADHVREVLFAMRFLLDTAVTRPGADLGSSPEQPFAPEPRQVDVNAALDGIDREAGSLHRQLSGLPADDWSRTVVIDGTTVDPRWIARHAVHDGTHHLDDIERLRGAL
jgi:hypothetical protein